MLNRLNVDFLFHPGVILSRLMKTVIIFTWIRMVTA
nr:MAG TPA: hypothetical protein [Caudoviricetes sp.]